MLGSKPESRRKRLLSELPQPNDTSYPTSKRQKLSYPSEPPASFWDNLSTIWLTKRALRELNRRNTEVAAVPSRTPHRRRACQCKIALYNSTDYLRACKPRILKNIKLFARQGGPDLSDLRNYPVAAPIHPSDHAIHSSQSSRSRRSNSSVNPPSTAPTKNTTKSKSTGAYDRIFQQHLVDNAVYPVEYEYPDGTLPDEPNNWEDLNQILSQPRRSLSSSHVSDQFKRLKRANEHAAKEKQVLEWVIPIIEGEIPDGRCRAGGVSFNNLDPLTDGILKPANPDIYYGARPEELSRNVRNELSGQIIPSTQHDLPMVPNFFVEAKGPDGSVAVAKRQACYNGALGARGMHSLQSYGKPPVVYDNNAYTVTSTYHDGNLKLYTSHIAPPRSPGHHPVYYMTQLEGYSMTGSQRSFIEGATAYRNVRDWAKKRRDEAIQNANAKEANPTKADAVAEDGGAILAASFTTALDTDEAYTVTQEVFRPSPDNADAYQESDSSEDATVYTSPAKRPKYKGQKRPRRKRHNADVSSCAGHSYGSALTPVSQDAVVGSVTTKQNERWP